MDNYTFDIYIYSTFFGVDTIIENVGYVLYLINIMGGMITPFWGGSWNKKRFFLYPFISCVEHRGLLLEVCDLLLDIW